ncbi:MAG: hypothetical protein H7A32_00035 [Deltaproteobacteria bacterium]|nr:hypothetical protein [Deltaproteobacteria bacterium]
MNQYKQKQNSYIFVDLSLEEDILKLSGPEKDTFLNAYNTQNILALQNNHICYGAFLNQKGKLITDSWILKHNEHFFLFIPKGYDEKLLKHLEIFLNFADVSLEALKSPYSHLLCMGSEASNVIEKFFQRRSIDESKVQNFFHEETEIILIYSNRFGCPTWEIFIPEDKNNLGQKILSENQKFIADPNLLEIFRIEAGYPKMGIDMDENCLVAEVGLDQRATSFTKGCYLGQETTARIQSIGKVNRQLQVFELQKPTSKTLPIPIEDSEGKQIGQLTSQIYSPKFEKEVGLGILNTKAMQASTQYKIDSETSLHILEKPLAKEKGKSNS